jgi:polysaccharide pyruvyl transferase CsaB
VVHHLTIVSTTVADRVTVAGWVGSTNLGDELLFRILCDLLGARGVAVCGPSVDPTGTAATHGAEAYGHLKQSALRHSLVASDAFVFGPGGLLQDETGVWNLPYHLRRIRIARRSGLPWAGIGLGADGLTTNRGRAQVRKALVGHTAIAVRDEPSFDALNSLGVERVVLAADLAFLVEPRPVAGDGVLGVSLRAPQSGRLRPGALDTGGQWSDGRADAMATALDDTVRSTGLTVRFLAFDARSDSVVHRQVAERMATAAEVVEPDLDGLVAALARVDAMVTMRYHGAVLAAAGGAGVVALPFSPKLRSIADDLGPGAMLLDDTTAGLPKAVASVLEHRHHIGDSVDRLRTLAGRNVEVLDDLLGAS